MCKCNTKHVHTTHTQIHTIFFFFDLNVLIVVFFFIWLLFFSVRFFNWGIFYTDRLSQTECEEHFLQVPPFLNPIHRETKRYTRGRDSKARLIVFVLAPRQRYSVDFHENVASYFLGWFRPRQHTRMLPKILYRLYWHILSCELEL